jgi:CheY-like chemotaxis protein
VVIQVTARPSAREEVREPDAEALEMAVRLTQMAGGRLQLPQTDVPGRQMLATLRLTPAERITVLAIEDNHDTLQLWDRYLHGTPFRLIGVQQPDEALAVAQEVEPEIILLDVMMPNVDGWSLLGRLRLHPATSGVPVIVCTVLPQRELALSLGASDFARKPLTRQAFLALLERQNVVSRRR